MERHSEHIRRFFFSLPYRLWVGLLSFVVLALMGNYFYSQIVIVKASVSDGQKGATLSFKQDDKALLKTIGIESLEHDAIIDNIRNEQTFNVFIQRSFDVDVIVDGETLTLPFTIGTVKQALEEYGITLSEDDYTIPIANSKVKEGMNKVEVFRVTYKEAFYDEVVPYETEYQYTSLFAKRQSRELLMQKGIDGYTSQDVIERYVNGELKSYEVIETSKTNREMQPEIIKVYGEGVPVSAVEAPEGITVTNNVPSQYSQMLTVKATGYSSKTGRGSSGLGLYYGTFAVDPTLIPYGTKVYIVSTDGRFVYGWAIATDTGAFIHSNRMQVDLFYETYEESAINGAWTVNVYIP